MSESRPYRPARQLERPPKSIAEVRQAAASAQRVLNDAQFVQFLDELQEDAADAALFEQNPEIRNESRIEVLMIAKLRHKLRISAAFQEEEREENERAALYE